MRYRKYTQIDWNILSRNSSHVVSDNIELKLGISISSLATSISNYCSIQDANCTAKRKLTNPSSKILSLYENCTFFKPLIIKLAPFLIESFYAFSISPQFWFLEIKSLNDGNCFNVRFFLSYL